MLDANRYELAMKHAGAVGGEYLHQLGKTDLATLGEEEWKTFVNAVCRSYVGKLAEIPKNSTEWPACSARRPPAATSRRPDQMPSTMPLADRLTPAMAINWMADLGERLVDCGYPVIPIWPGAKCPGRFRSTAGWQGYPDWARHCDRPTKSFELAIWKTWPGCGIGIPCGIVGALDIDLLDPELVLKIDALARRELGDAPTYRVGLAPKRLLPYRMATPFRKIVSGKIEFIGRGAQFVAYGVHPDTRKEYSWFWEPLHEVPAHQLPEVTEDQVRQFLDKAAGLLPEELRRHRLGSARSGEFRRADEGPMWGTHEATAEALRHIPNNDAHYDDWIRVCLATKGSRPEDGFPLFEEWSARSSKYDAKNTAKAWRSAKPRELGFQTLWGWARDNGWVPDHDLIFRPHEAEALATVDISALVAKARALPVPKAPSPHDPETGEVTEEAADMSATADIDDIVAKAPGSLGRMVRWMTATAVSPQPLLGLGASLCAHGTIMGRRYRLDSPDTRSNIYVIALADSGSGKDHSRRCVRRAFSEAGLPQYLGGETLASGSALFSSVFQHPCRLFQIDEFGHFVQAVLDPKSHAWHRREIMTNLTTLWSSASEVVIGTEYANQKDRPRLDIHQPCVCVYGSTVPLTFWSALQSGNIGDGSIARFLVLQTPKNYPEEQTPENIEKRLPEIVADLKAIAAGAAEHDAGNLAMVPTMAAEPYTVPMTDAAVAADIALRTDHLAMKREHEGTQFSAIVARFREHVRRVALIAAVADDPAVPVLGVGHFEWATAFVRSAQDMILEQAKRFVADSQHEALVKKVLDIIRRHGGVDGRQHLLP